jgi:hypothetical protein
MELRPADSKTRNFCPSEKKVARFQASLSSPSERNHARSAFKRFFHPLAFAESIFRSWGKSACDEPSSLTPHHGKKCFHDSLDKSEMSLLN